MTNFIDGVEAIQGVNQCIWVDNIKVTSVEQFDFNDMIGYQCLITIKVVPIKGYKGRMFQIITNSTWLDEIDPNMPIKEAIQSYLDILSI